MVTLLVAILSGVVYGTIAGFSRSESISKEQREMDETAAGIISKMMFELSTTTAGQLTNGAHAGSSGGDDSTNRSFFGQHSGDGATNSVLHFIALNGGALGLPVKSNIGPVEIVYKIEEQNQSINTITPRRRLIREEFPADVAKSSPEAFKLRARRYILTDKLTSFSLGFYYRGKWSPAFTQPYPGLPQAVQIEIGLTADSGRTFNYKTAVIATQDLLQ